jgi:hypothetical protein
MPNQQSRPVLAALLALYDEAFVKQAYEVVLVRSPDPGGLQNYLAQVRGGVLKEQIIAELAESPEGKAKAIEIQGLEELIGQYRKRRSVSFWQRLVRRLTIGATEPVERQLRVLGNDLYLLRQTVNAQADRIADLITTTKTAKSLAGSDARGSYGHDGQNEHSSQVLALLQPRLRRTFRELKNAIVQKGSA